MPESPYLFHSHLNFKFSISFQKYPKITQKLFGTKFGRVLIFLVFCHILIFKTRKNTSQNQLNLAQTLNSIELTQKFTLNRKISHQFYPKIYFKPSKSPIKSMLFLTLYIKSNTLPPNSSYSKYKIFIIFS